MAYEQCSVNSTELHIISAHARSYKFSVREPATPTDLAAIRMCSHFSFDQSSITLEGHSAIGEKCASGVKHTSYILKSIGDLGY